MSADGQLTLKSSNHKPLEASPSDDSDNEKWLFIGANGGGYYIQNKATKKVMDIPGSKTENGTPVNSFPTFHKGNNQKFYLKVLWDCLFVYLWHLLMKLLL